MHEGSPRRGLSRCPRWSCKKGANFFEGDGIAEEVLFFGGGRGGDGVAELVLIFWGGDRVAKEVLIFLEGEGTRLQKRC